MKSKHILVSQPEPADVQKSPYANLINKYKAKIDFIKFIKIEGVEASEVRQDHVKLNEYTAIIMTFLPHRKGNAFQRA